MDHIPYGNTLLVKWHIKRGGTEQPLTGLDLSLTLTLPNGDVKNMPFIITDGNIINMLYEGKDQEHIGEYYLDLYENRGINSQLRIDAAPAFHLVAHTFQAQWESDPNLEVYTIELEGDIDVNTPSNAVTFTPQLLTDDQQAQARENINAKKGGYTRLQKVAPYCAEIWFDGVDYEAADRYFAGNYEAQIGACTAVFKNGMLGRNFDWPYSDYTGFLVHTPAISGRHAVMGASGYLPGLTDAVVDSGVWNEKYNLLPFLMVDGINDAGLSAAVLVCENKGVTPTTGTNPGEKRMNGLFIVRYALDNHTDALEAANDIAQNFDVYMPHTETADEELHYVFCDKTQMVILEFSNNEAHVITGKNWLTNFKVFGTTQNADGTIDYSTVHPYGQGCERYDEIAKFGAGGDIPEEQTQLFLAYVLIAMRYTNAYAENSTWLTEFTGIHDELTVQAAASTPGIFAQTMEVARQRFLERDRQNPETWQTCHSVVYDSKTLTAYISVQETYGFVTRQLSGLGLTPSEVREIVHEETDDAIEGKQDKLVSGENIKTINGTSVLGSGDIEIPKGDPGEQGPVGPAGPAGPQGPAGQDGAITEDAPSDGSQYARKDRAWVKVQGGEGAVRYDEAQTLTPAQQAQARENIDVPTFDDGAETQGGVIPNVRYDEQTLTEAQKRQARSNIGASRQSVVLRPFDDIQSAYTMSAMDWTTGTFTIVEQHDITAGDWVTIVPNLYKVVSFKDMTSLTLGSMSSGAFKLAQVTSVNGDSIVVSDFINESQAALTLNDWILVKVSGNGVILELPSAFQGRGFRIRIKGNDCKKKSDGWNIWKIVPCDSTVRHYPSFTPKDIGNGHYIDTIYEFGEEMLSAYDLSNITGTDTSGSYRWKYLSQANKSDFTIWTHLLIPYNFCIYGNQIIIEAI